MTLKELGIGESAIITAVGGEGALRQHFLDMGVIPGTEVTVIKYAPLGDPVELKIHGYQLTLRVNDAAKIEIDKSAVSKEVPSSGDTTAALIQEAHDSYAGHIEHPAHGFLFRLCTIC